MQRSLRTILAISACMTLTVAAQAQGSDDCSTAAAISGTGTFAVNTTAATDSAQQPNTCVLIHRDVWFAWTAAATQSMSLSTCGGTTVDTVESVYAGSTCPVSGSQIACNDDARRGEHALQAAAALRTRTEAHTFVARQVARRFRHRDDVVGRDRVVGVRQRHGTSSAPSAFN